MIQWTEILSEDIETLKKTADELKVHPLALEDCIHRDQRAKLEEYENHQLLVWFLIAHNRIYEVQFLIFEKQILMVPHERPPEGESWKQYLGVNDGAKDVLHMLYQALDKCTDITWHSVQVLFDAIDDFEQRMFDQDCDPRALMTLKKRLSEIDFSLVHLPSVVEQIQNYYRPKDDLRWRFRDLHDHCLRVYRDIGLYRSQISGAIDLYWGYQANRANKNVQRLSVLASVSVPLTFWASFWGMNFEAIPFANKNFFYGAMVLMVLSVGATFLFLVKKGYWSSR
jgi:magnesium transporter